MEQTLVLNATYEPLKIVSWQRAMVLWCQQKVEILEDHAGREVRAVSFSMPMPSVVRLLRFVNVKRRGHVPFTRINIYARDGFRCQYCGHSFPTEDLTFDHVVPASRGGKRTWENIATACLDCNKRKDARTPAEAGMALLSKPKRPNASPVFHLSVGIRTAPDSWRSYLYWNAELEA